MAALVKSLFGPSMRLVSAEAIQMHGGIGVTDECDIGLYYTHWFRNRETL